MIRKSRLLTAAIVYLGIIGVLTSVSAAQQTKSLRARMVSTGLEEKATGNAVYDQKDKEIRFSAAAKGLSDSRTISVFVEGNLIGSAKVDIDGSVELEMSQPGREMYNGDSVEIRNRDGKTILRGVLRERKWSPIDDKK
jgi:hypothetical protein